MSKLKKTALIVSDVLASPMTRGVAVNDVVLRINGKPAAEWYGQWQNTDTNAEYLQVRSQYVYDCVSAQTGESYQITTPVLAPMRLTPCSEFLMDKIQKDEDEWEYLELLWERDEQAHLAVAADQVMGNVWVARLIGFIFRQDIVSTPALLCQGIVQYHRGNVSAAKKKILRYAKKGMDNYTTNFHALAYYYLGLLSDDSEQKAHYFNSANEYNRSRSVRLNALLQAEGLTLIQENKNQGREFPMDMEFPAANGSGMQYLFSLITRAQHELTPICVMPGYRANGPYGERLRTYARLWPHFSKYLNPMIVLADNEEYDNTAHHLKTERALMEANVPLTVLMDVNHMVCDELELSVSPIMYVVNRQGKIVYEGDLIEPLDYWALIHID